MQTAPTIKKKKILDLGMVDDTESSTMSVTNPFTAAALRPQVSRINMPGRSTPASILAEGLQTLAILAKENLHREYFKINSALQKKCEYMKRSLNIENLNYLKPSNKKGKGENYCRIIEINQTQRSNLSEEPVVPAHPPNSCPNCSESKFTTLSSNNLCIFVTLSGRYDLYTPIFRCKCGYVDEELGKAMHQSGFYSTGRNSSTFYSINLLDSWHFLKRSSPGTSLQALVSALELFGASRGRHGPINFETTKRVFFEWRFHQYELGRIKGEFDKGCPACDTTPVAVHIDGNKKLYRYNKVGRGIRNSYYSGGIFACDKEVQDHVSTIQNLKTQSSHMCGVSTLKAAKNKPVSFRSLDETGISMASCRHGIILAALNMYQGELYSYAHYLQMNRLQNVSFICQDIICKYWPWALKISSREQKFSLRQGKPFLGVLHAKGHSWYCQVLYGGRWQEGSGLTSGEEAEQVFSYLSRYNNNIKNMLKAERTEELTEGALFWNHRKINGMPRALVARFRKATETAAAVSNEIHRLNVPESVIEKWRSELLIIARSLNNRSSANNIEHTIEAYGENIRHRKNQITTYAVSSKMRAVLRNKNEVEKKKLRDLIKIYNQNHPDLSEADVLTGILPWHNLLLHQNTSVSLTEKRSAVEKFELQKRCREEESLTIQEMITWLQYYKKKRDKISEYIQELQCDSFPSCLCKDSNTYTIENPILSEEEKRGLLALLKQGQKQCADKLTEAKHLFSSYQPNEVYEPFLELLESDEDEDMYLQNE
ncbi:uncharacterized protein [Procambarus clarkii]|uniref:uncharacterized protein isoform X2 n=1 Tax=Procambarus clarkii TaxID=6728 RepID=UPI003743DAF8